MILFVLRRLTVSVLLLLLVLSATFLLLHVAPGDPIQTLLAQRQNPSEAFIAFERARLGLDRSLPEQYVRWLYGVVVQGEWGRSASGQPAMTPLLEALPNTIWLTAAVLLVQHLVGLSLGILAAVRQDRATDLAIRGLALVLFAAPVFWLAHLLIELVGVHLGWLPFNGMRSDDNALLSPGSRVIDLLRHLALPAFVLALAGSAGVIRLVRNSMIEVLGQDYIRAARARGLSPARVLWRHALPNTLGPVIQRLGVNLPMLLSGALIIEVIFAWPGIGRVTYNAIRQLDDPVVLAATALTGTVVVLGTFLADILHAWLDPRVREGHG